MCGATIEDPLKIPEARWVSSFDQSGSAEIAGAELLSELSFYRDIVPAFDSTFGLESVLGGKLPLADDVFGRHAQELLDEHGTGAVPTVFLLMLMKAHPSD